MGPLTGRARGGMTHARLLLTALAAGGLIVGGWARFASRSFYDDFPVSGWNWVSDLGAYNGHLAGDFGNTILGLAVATGYVVLRPSTRAAEAMCIAWTVASLPHLAFHLHHLSGFPAVQQALMLIVLTAPVVLALAAFAACRSAPRRAA